MRRHLLLALTVAPLRSRREDVPPLDRTVPFPSVKPTATATTPGPNAIGELF